MSWLVEASGAALGMGQALIALKNERFTRLWYPVLLGTEVAAGFGVALVGLINRNDELVTLGLSAETSVIMGSCLAISLALLGKILQEGRVRKLKE